MFGGGFGGFGGRQNARRGGGPVPTHGEHVQVGLEAGEAYMCQLYWRVLGIINLLHAREQVGLPLTFMEAVQGANKSVSFMANVKCGTCDGTGAAPGSKPVTCTTCKGSGRVCGPA